MARRQGSCRVLRHPNPKPSLWIGQKSSPPSSSRSSSKNWPPLHKSTPSYHTFLWKSDRVPTGLCDESNLTLKDFKRLFSDVFFFFLSFSGTTWWRNLLDQVIYTTIFKKNDSVFIFQAKMISFMCFQFHVCSLVKGVWQPRRMPTLSARKSRPVCWSLRRRTMLQKSELQVHQPKTAERWFEQKQQYFLATVSPYLNLRVLPSLWMSSTTSSNHSKMSAAQCGSVKYSGGLSGELLPLCCRITQQNWAPHGASTAFWGRAFEWAAWKCCLKSNCCGRLAAGMASSDIQTSLFLCNSYTTTFLGRNRMVAFVFKLHKLFVW